MAKWASANLLDGGLTYLAANGNRLILLKTYSTGDSYTAVNVTNNICQVALAGGDYTLAGAAGADRTATTAIKSAAATVSSGAGPDLWIAIVDTINAAVLFVTNETSDQVVTNGNTVNFPAVVYTVKQPV